jgi:uncharacterized protein YndB with AHSA1/START domain
MPYIATIPVVFPYPRERVFEALIDLDLYSYWNSGLQSVSHTGKLVPGMRFRVESLVAGGRVNVSDIEVTQLVHPELIELVSNTGVVRYRVTYELRKYGVDATEVICVLRFEFKNFVLDLARPVIEAMAATRIRGDLETLKIILGDGRT